MKIKMIQLGYLIQSASYIQFDRVAFGKRASVQAKVLYPLICLNLETNGILLRLQIRKYLFETNFFSFRLLILIRITNILFSTNEIFHTTILHM